MQEKWFLCREMQGIFIEVLQARLKELGITPINVNGIFDDHTREAVCKLQYKLHLPVTGVVDRTFWHWLQNMVEEKKETSRALNSPLQSARYRPVIFVDVRSRRLFLYSGKEQIAGPFAIATGKAQTPTPEGTFSVLYKKINPGGILGTRWIAFTEKNHAIHGTNQTSSIGKPVTRGCIRMLNRDIEALYDRIKIGTTVLIDHHPPENIKKISAAGSKQKFLPGIYTVQIGDTLSHLAEVSQTTEKYLMEINHLPTNRIYPGQTLIIPGKYRIK